MTDLNNSNVTDFLRDVFKIFIVKYVVIFAVNRNVRLRDNCFLLLFRTRTNIFGTLQHHFRIAGYFGNVRYSVEATIKTGLFKFDFDFNAPFLVNCIFDLNKIPGLGVSDFVW